MTLGRAEQPGIDAARLQCDRVAQGEFLLQGAVGRHPVVHPARKLANLGVQGAAHGDIDLLKAAANAKDRLAAGHAGADQPQGDRVAATVEGAMRLGRFVAVFLGVDIGPPARQQKAVEAFHQFLDGHVSAGSTGRSPAGIRPHPPPPPNTSARRHGPGIRR
jgi:hypothetical protein